MADNSNLRFQQRDFLGILADAKAYMRERLGDRWDDDTEADEVTVILEKDAYELQNLHFYTDQQKRESDLITATRLVNVYNKAVREGYVPHGYKAASGELTLRFVDAVGYDDEGNEISPPVNVVIPRGSLFQTNNGTNDLIVSTLEDQIIPGPINPAVRSDYSIHVHQGVIRQATYTRSDITQNGYIKINSQSTVTSNGYTKVTFNRSAQESIVFKQVDDVLSDYQQGNYFSVYPLFLRDQTLAMIQFAYNWTSQIDTDGTIVIEYFETNKTDGSIVASKYISSSNSFEGGVSVLNSTLMDSADSPAQVNSKIGLIFNQTPILGWDEIESIASIKINFKNAIRDLSTLVTLQDYVDFVFRETSVNTSGEDIDKDKDIPANVAYIYFDMPGTGPLKTDMWQYWEPFNPPVEDGSEAVLKYVIGYLGIDSVYGNNLVWNAGNPDPNVPHTYNDFWKYKYNGIVEKTWELRGRPNNLIVFVAPRVTIYEISAIVYLYDVKNGQTDINNDVRVIFDNIVSELTVINATPSQSGRTHYMSRMIDLIHNASERVASVELIQPSTDQVADLDTVLRFVIKPNSFRFIQIGKEGSDVVLPSEGIDSQDLI